MCKILLISVKIYPYDLDKVFHVNYTIWESQMCVFNGIGFSSYLKCLLVRSFLIRLHSACIHLCKTKTGPYYYSSLKIFSCYHWRSQRSNLWTKFPSMGSSFFLSGGFTISTMNVCKNAGSFLADRVYSQNYNSANSKTIFRTLALVLMKVNVCVTCDRSSAYLRIYPL